MATAEIDVRSDVPLWRRVIDFPLVAMVIAVGLYVAAAALAGFLNAKLPSLPGYLKNVQHAAVYIILGLVAYKLVIRRLGAHPRDDFSDRHSMRNLGLGLAAGVLIFSAVVGVAAIIGVYNLIGFGGTSELVKDLAAVAILPAFMEELLFRGILFRWLEDMAGSWAALLLTSALFGLAHIMNPGATWFSSFAIAMEAGLLLGGGYMLTRSLWMPMGLHAAWNFTQGFIFDVPVSGMDQHGLVNAKLSGPVLLSGGAFGLEASVIAMSIATAAGLWLIWLAVRRGTLISPWWVRRRLNGPAA